MPVCWVTLLFKKKIKIKMSSCSFLQYFSSDSSQRGIANAVLISTCFELDLFVIC